MSNKTKKSLWTIGISILALFLIIFFTLSSDKSTEEQAYHPARTSATGSATQNELKSGSTSSRKIPDYPNPPELIENQVQMVDPASLPPDLPDDLKQQILSTAPDLPEDLKAQLSAPVGELPPDIAKALATPARIVTIDEVNNPDAISNMQNNDLPETPSFEAAEN